jgi:hypothetical protein
VMRPMGLRDLYNPIRQSVSEKNAVSLDDIERRHRDYKAIKELSYLAVYSH